VPDNRPLPSWARQLIELRRARAWSAADLAREMKKRRDGLPPVRSLAHMIQSDWETGKHRPGPRYRLLLAALYDADEQQIFGDQAAPEAFSQRAHRPDGELAELAGTLDMAWGSTPADQLVDADARHKPDDGRLEYLGSRGQVSRDDLIAAIAAESQEFGEWVGMSEVADATIAQYQAQAQRLAQVFEHEASLPLLLETRRLRDRVTSRLRGHQRIDQARDLYLLAAQVCGLLAWMTGDLGNYRAADTHAWTAWMCAEQAGHDAARAWVRATQAKLAYWDGRYTESAQLAEDGLGYDSPDSARVFLALFRARALASAGQRDQARQALTLAEAERDRVAAADLLGGIWELTPGRYHGLAASTRLLLDEPGIAVAEASEAITLSKAAPPGERHLYAELLVRTVKAQAHLRQPDLDGAAAALRPVMDLPADVRTEPLLQQLHRLRRSLSLPQLADAPKARELQDEIETYDREALPRQISA